jgi:hypothetical protein
MLARSMTDVEIPKGSGHKYRYDYDDGKMVYRGPVGEAPQISEAEFLAMVTMFPDKEPANQHLAEIISIESGYKARQAVTTLNEEWKYLKHRDAKVARVKAVTLAANRARASMKRENISTKEREQFRDVAQIYEAWVRAHKGKYN